MNLKENKGVVGIDVSIAVIILLILVPTIMGIVYFVNSTKVVAKVKNGALNIAINAIETAKGYADLENLTEANIRKDLNNGIYAGKITINSDNEAIIATDDASYKLKIIITDYNEKDETATANVVKTVKVVVEYKAREKNIQSLELSTVVK